MPTEHDVEGEQYERFVVLFTRHEPDLRGFVRSLLPTWDDVDEVMQEVGLAAWRKFASLENADGFLRWSCVIARFEVLKYRRKHARDRLVFDEDVIELLAEDRLDRAAEAAERQHALEQCLKECLSPTERKLVLQAYASDTTIKELAEQSGQPPSALYKALNRIRRSLQRCVRRRLAMP